KKEPARHHIGDSRRCLRNNRRMNPDRRTSNSGSDLQFFCCMSKSSKYTPDKRTLALPISPGMIMIRNHCEGKTHSLSSLRILDQIIWSVLLAAEFVANFNHPSPRPSALYA